LVKARLEKQARWGRPDSVVCTAATNETSFTEPRPGLPPVQPPRSRARRVCPRSIGLGAD
jgi:hypothetical protein